MSHITVHLFDLFEVGALSLADLLKGIHKKPLDERWRPAGPHPIGLQEIKHDTRRRIHLLDFVKRRAIGPGRVRVAGNVESFNFDPGEEFGEETAALYDEQNQWLVVQYNQHGSRIGAIGDYLNQWDPEATFMIEPKLSNDAEEQLLKRSQLRKLSFRVRASQTMLKTMRESGISLGEGLARMATSSGSQWIDVELSIRQRKGELSSEASGLLKLFASRIDDDEVKRLQVKARTSVDGSEELIDFIKQRIAQKCDDRDLEVVNGRYTLESRWRALLRVHAGWLQQHGE